MTVPDIVDWTEDNQNWNKEENDQPFHQGIFFSGFETHSKTSSRFYELFLGRQKEQASQTSNGIWQPSLGICLLSLLKENRNWMKKCEWKIFHISARLPKSNRSTPREQRQKSRGEKDFHRAGSKL